ncbi:MAG: DUF2807 domain-containing protein [Bacteroidales bacterium]|nr:DUF2807 domain-containing protein [Bacteroidales bacterium]
MKTNVILKKLFILLFISFTSVSLMAQMRGNGHVISKTFDLSAFNEISVGGSFEVTLTQSTEQKVVITVDENLMDRIEVKVVGGELQLSTRMMQNPTKLHAEISVPSLTSIDASGATSVKTTNKFTGSAFEVEVSGASEVNFTGDFTKLNIELTGASELNFTGLINTMTAEISGASEGNYKGDCETIEVDLSGSSDLILTGKGKMLNAEISGASGLKAVDFEVVNASVEASGASEAALNVTGTLDGEESGASDIHNIRH